MRSRPQLLMLPWMRKPMCVAGMGGDRVKKEGRKRKIPRYRDVGEGQRRERGKGDRQRHRDIPVGKEERQ